MAAAPHHLALVLLLDTSGSMVQSDPTGGRAAVVQAVAKDLGTGDSLGLVTFSDTPAVLLPLGAMGTPAAAAAADAALPGIGASGGVNLLAALEAGQQLLATDTQSADAHVLLLLTGGASQTPAASQTSAAKGTATTALLDAAAAAIAAHGWALDVVGLGTGAGTPELQTLASLGGGRYMAASDATAAVAAATALLPPSQAPPAAPPPVVVSLQAIALARPVSPGAPVALPVEAANPGTSPIRLAVTAPDLPAGWAAASPLVVPPGMHRLTLRLWVGPAADAATVAVALAAPSGARLDPADLTWRLRVRPWWEVRVLAAAPALALGLVAAVCAVLLLGYTGLMLRVLPQLRARGRIEVTAPSGESLGVLRVPRRREVSVGAAAAADATLRLPWVPGEDRLFRLRAELVAGPVAGWWLAGLRAWRDPPHAVVYAEAVWPYHLYPGPLPRQRVDLYEETSFGVAGLTFTFHTGPRHPDLERVGTDVLGSLPPG